MRLPAQQLALWADQLRDISALGLHFAHDLYDEQHYRTVQDIAMAMLAFATGTPLEDMEPLRAPIFNRPTPLAVGDAAMIDEDGQILLTFPMQFYTETDTQRQAHIPTETVGARHS